VTTRHWIYIYVFCRRTACTYKIYRYFDVLIKVIVQQGFCHLPIVPSTNTHIENHTVMIEIIHTLVAYTTVLGFGTRTTRDQNTVTNYLKKTNALMENKGIDQL